MLPLFSKSIKGLCTATSHGIHSNYLVLTYKLLHNLAPTFLPQFLTLHLTNPKSSHTEYLQSQKCCAISHIILHMLLRACAGLSLIPIQTLLISKETSIHVSSTVKNSLTSHPRVNHFFSATDASLYFLF